MTGPRSLAGRVARRIAAGLRSTPPPAPAGDPMLPARVGHLEAYAEQALQDLRDELASVKRDFARLERDMVLLQVDNVEVRGALDLLKARFDDVRADAARERARFHAALGEQRPADGAARSRPSDVAETGEAVPAPLTDLHYIEFEDRFRGSRQAVRDLLGVYLEDVRHLAGGKLPVVDIGFGRGEWLEILKDNAIPASGVDTNHAAVAAAASRGLCVEHGDGLERLGRVPAGSVGAITAFHVVEHLSPADLVSFVDVSARALAPGGILIIESPNPMNLLVGASDFYLDPTHVRPVHPQYLEFLVSSRGLECEVRYLHPRHDSLPRPAPTFTAADTALAQMADRLNALMFAGRDYGLVARAADLR